MSVAIRITILLSGVEMAATFAGCDHRLANAPHDRAVTTRNPLAEIGEEDLRYDASTAGVRVTLPVEAMGTITGQVPDRERLIAQYRRQLEDGENWIAAHVMLSYLTDHWKLGVPDRRNFRYFNGLKVDLPAHGDAVVEQNQKGEIQSRWRKYFERTEQE